MPRKSKAAKRDSGDDAAAASHAGGNVGSKAQTDAGAAPAQQDEQLEHETRSGLHYVDTPGGGNHGHGGEKIDDTAQKAGGQVEHEMRSGLHYVDLPAPPHHHRPAEEAVGSKAGSGGAIEERAASGGISQSKAGGAGLVKKVVYVINHEPAASTIGELRVEAAKRYSVSPDHLTILDAATERPLEPNIALTDLKGDLLVNVKEKTGKVTPWVFSFRREGGGLAGTKRKAEVPAEEAAASASIEATAGDASIQEGSGTQQQPLQGEVQQSSTDVRGDDVVPE